MKPALFSIALVFLYDGAAFALDLDELIDRVDDRLRLTVLDQTVRARLSGTLDLEGYWFSDPAPGLIDTTADKLFNPRLSLFIDAQAGAQLYFFSQARLDRGFDPSGNGLRVGLDEYALRVTPWASGVLNVQLGKFATIAGNWVERHLSWDNPFINAPLPYEYVTAVSDIELPRRGEPFAEPTQRKKYEHLPLIWGPSYATGVSVAGVVAKLEYAVELKNSSLSSRPETWDLTRRGFSDPTVTGHLIFRPDQRWKIGFSASEGAYLREDAAHLLGPGEKLGDFKQQLLGQDVSFAWHHLQLWAEVYEVRFDVPRAGEAAALAYYVEAKYKLTPQLHAGVRWNQAFFSNVPESGDKSWSSDDSRIEGVIGHRFSAHTQLKLQYYVDLKSGSRRDVSHTIATQFTVRF